MNRSQGYVLLATLWFSSILIFSTVLKNTGVSSLEQLLFRLTFGLVILAAFMLVKRSFRLLRRVDSSLFLVLGIVYSLFSFSGLSGLAFGAPITVVSALVYTQPIFTAIISQATGREKVTKVKICIILLGFSGAFLVSGLELANFKVGLNVIFPVLAGFFYALYLWLKRKAINDTDYKPFQILFYTFLFAIPVTMIIGAALQNVIINPLFIGIKMPNPMQLGLLLLFAVFGTILPYGLLNYVNPREISPISEGLLLLGDPVLHTLWAILLFGQFVAVSQYAGAGLILLSAALNLRFAARSG